MKKSLLYFFKMKRATLCFISLFIFQISFSQNITTIAGNGTAGFSGDGSAATAAELKKPAGVFIDGSGNIYIADFGNNRVRMVNSLGIISTIAGNGTSGFSGDGGPATSAELNSPEGLAIDGSGNIYIADSHNNRIRKVSAAGNITTIAGNGTAGYTGDGGAAISAELNSPFGIAVDATGNIYIADNVNSRIRMVNKAGIITTIAGDSLAGFTGDGGLATKAELSSPADVTIDSSGNIYIADEGNARIRKINTSGIIKTVAGDSTAGYSGDGGNPIHAELQFPTDVKVDLYGNIYIADFGNNRIREVTLANGQINTIAGNGTGGYSGDGGPATTAEVNGPIGIAINGGNLFIADFNNNRVREVAGAVGVHELKVESEKVKVYPNPSSNGRFSVVINNYQLIINNTVEVYNMVGEKVFQQLSILNSPFSINLKGSPSGIYLYRVISESGNLIGEGKLVIQ